MIYCDRCGKKVEGKIYRVENFGVCKGCYPKVKYELGKTKVLRIGGQQ